MIRNQPLRRGNRILTITDTEAIEEGAKPMRAPLPLGFSQAQALAKFYAPKNATLKALIMQNA